MGTLNAAAKQGKSLVIGTTGFSTAQRESIRKAASGIRCVLAPNMSIGVNVLFKIASDVAKTLGDAYDVEIVEAHHKFKKDAPSGTAVRLSEIIAESLERNIDEVGVYGRKGMTERTPREIGVHTLRAGDIVGEHRVCSAVWGKTWSCSSRSEPGDVCPGSHTRCKMGCHSTARTLRYAGRAGASLKSGVCRPAGHFLITPGYEPSRSKTGSSFLFEADIPVSPWRANSCKSVWHFR